MENQIEMFKKDKIQNYYKYLKMFAILQRESNRVVRELWTLVKNALNDISPNAGKDEEYHVQQISGPQQGNKEGEEVQKQDLGEGGEAPEE